MNDLIKREDALKELRLDNKDVIYIDKTECARRIKAIPSADRPQGEWLDYEIPLEDGGAMPIQVCNLCKTFYPLAYTGGGHRFCPNCGARMKDVTEGLESRTDLIWYGDKTDLIGDETGRHTGWFGKGADDEDN